MRQQFKVAFRKLIRRCKSIRTRSFCCDAKLLGKQQLIPPLFTWTTSSPRNYSKFSTHITTERAMDLLCNLDEKERSNLRFALDKIDADKEKKLYEIESAAPPSAPQLYSIFFVNAVPFVAFGFLDNFIMIMAGEYIEYYLGHVITLSTMAAAGLGNTISDILGITMATYVENGCQILGLKQPKLTPAQFELKSSKRSSSYGRVVGITVGCLLGMCPLWFMEEKTDKKDVYD
ncbi:transmembrane protein 65 isoform X3 [Drosophila biarmipes]|uniref:transmembrane protein 65 isoform X3 n=1 Tax=Drosophila biarmipes TaxID=125945 RepID=UPI001CDAD139|nr:transmembrane protein 65 isoform X3 [Drosophila biarmipes]